MNALSNWSTYLYTPHHNTFISDTFAPPLRLVWRFEHGDYVWGAPIIIDDVVYLLNGSLYALSLHSGEVLWINRDWEAVADAVSPTFWHNHILAYGIGGIFIGFDRQSGEQVWEYPTGDMVFSTPAYANGRLVIGRAKAHVIHGRQTHCHQSPDEESTMVKKYIITFDEPGEPITQPVTKFGGQPVWIEAPAWPLSATTGNPMMFLCQIALEAELFGDIPPKMAYIFMTDEDVEGTWDPHSGENAVILQPDTGTQDISTRPLHAGPTLQQWDVGEKVWSPVDVCVWQEPGEDPLFLRAETFFQWGEAKYPRQQMKAAWTAYQKALAGNKIGGTPGFLQNDDFPDYEHDWRLLLQLDSALLPPALASINFGDAGIGYAFISADGTIGKFLWQCM